MILRRFKENPFISEFANEIIIDYILSSLSLLIFHLLYSATEETLKELPGRQHWEIYQILAIEARWQDFWYVTSLSHLQSIFRTISV